MCTPARCGVSQPFQQAVVTKRIHLVFDLALVVLISCGGPGKNTAPEQQQPQDTTVPPPKPQDIVEGEDTAASTQVPVFESYSDFMEGTDWRFNETERSVPAQEIPGQLLIKIMFSDGDEIDATGLKLRDKYVDSPEFADRRIDEIKIEMTTAVAGYASFEIFAIWDKDPSTARCVKAVSFENVPAGESVDVRLNEYDDTPWPSVLCASIRALVYSDFKHQTVTFAGDCDF